MNTIEYRIRPVTRFIVSRHVAEDDMPPGSEVCGEFTSLGHATVAARGLVTLEPGAKLLRLPEGEESAPAALTADGDRI